MPSLDERRVSEATGLSDATIEKCAQLLSGIWTGEARHFVTLHVSVWCARIRCPEETAWRLIEKTCALAADRNIRARRTAVTESYAKMGPEKASIAALREIFRESVRKSLPGLSDRARRAVESTGLTVLSILTGPMPDRAHRGLADFRLVRVVKFQNTDPMMMNVVFEKNGRHLFVGTVNTFFTFAKFQKAVREQLGIELADISDDLWHRMISHRPSEIRKAPEGGGMRMKP